MQSNTTGKSITTEGAADLITGGVVTNQVRAGDLIASWVRDAAGNTAILVQGLGATMLLLEGVR